MAMTCPLCSAAFYTRFNAATRQSAPSQRIGTFSLAIGTAYAFYLIIAGKVLMFRTTAWSSFALPTRRMSLGQHQDIHRADPEVGPAPGFDIV